MCISNIDQKSYESSGFTDSSAHDVVFAYGINSSFLFSFSFHVSKAKLTKCCVLQYSVIFLFPTVLLLGDLLIFRCNCPGVSFQPHDKPGSDLCHWRWEMPGSCEDHSFGKAVIETQFASPKEHFPTLMFPKFTWNALEKNCRDLRPRWA